jgi:glyoxylate/hydroxypyruvate reductase A
MAGPTPRRGLLAAAEIEPDDAARLIASAGSLGVHVTHAVAETADELLELLRSNPDIEVMLSDFLPDVAGSASMYAFDRAVGSDDGGDPAARAAEDAVLAAIVPLRWVQLPSVGVNQETASVTWRRAPQVAVTTASGLASVAMSQYVAASVLFHAHRLWRLPEYRDVRDWSVRRAFQPSILIGRTVGLLGYGGVGRRVAHILANLGMRVIAVRRSPGRSAAEGYRRPEIEALDAGPEPAEIRGLDDLEWLLRESEYLVSTVPLTPESRGLIGARELAMLPRGAVVINVSRGPIFDEDALTNALRSGQLGGASLDVFRVEPLPADSPLWDMPNVMITPHSSGTHDRVSAFTTDLFLENLARYVDGRPLLNMADRSRGY